MSEKTFGQRLKEIRIELNLTQKQIAKIMGVNERQYRDYEKDVRYPLSNRLIPLAKIYNVNLNWLLTGEGKKYLTK